MGQTRLETQALMLAAPAIWTKVQDSNARPQTLDSNYFIERKTGISHQPILTSCVFKAKTNGLHLFRNGR